VPRISLGIWSLYAPLAMGRAPSLLSESPLAMRFCLFRKNLVGTGKTCAAPVNQSERRSPRNPDQPDENHQEA
ncbi:MAG TPA: hypothetical protein H9827_06840, partial [Candidatus Luteimonas excrementigallinarum]|nr:hypothetical protein [Candidatus Luteimonas excrementigallinarum]